MTLNELIDKLVNIKTTHGDAVGSLVVWGNATDKMYKFPIESVALNRRGAGDRILISEAN